jgi:hypothetical protein
MEVSTEPAVGAATASHGAVVVGARLVGAAAARDGVDRL